MKNIIIAISCSLILSSCMQDERAPVDYKEGVFYGRGATYDRAGGEVPKYNNYNRAELPDGQDEKYVNDAQHQYGVSAEVGKVEAIELAPPEPVRSVDLPAAPSIIAPVIVAPNISSGTSITSPDPFIASNAKPSLMPDFEKTTAQSANNKVDETKLNWQKTEDNAENKYDAKMLQAEAKLAATEQAAKLQQQADKELVAVPKIAPLATIVAPEAPAAPAPAPSQASVTNPALAKEKFIWPLKGKLLKDYNTDASKGLVIAGRTGEPVRASASGVVVHVGEKIKSFGNMIIVQHPDGYVTTYSHLSDTTVSANDNVVGGQLIGFVGKTGNAPQPQLHFAVRHNTQPIDPAKKLSQ